MNTREPMRNNRTNAVAAFPLYACYWMFPAVMLCGHAAGLDVARNWLDVLWLGLGGVALLRLLAVPVSGRGKRVLGVSALICGLLALGMLRFFWPAIQDGFMPVPWAMELKPLLYVAVAALAACAFGLPRPRHYVVCGRGLALLILGELFLELARTGRVARPHGSGEINYDAMLLLLSLCFCLRRERRADIGLLVAAIAATFSRTAIIGAAGVLLWCGPFGPGRRLLFLGLGAVGVWAAFRVRGLDGALDALDRIWMWEAAADCAGQALTSLRFGPLLFGFWPGMPLPLPVPPQLVFLWALQAQTWGVQGVHAFNLHAFWLRMAATWGVAAALGLALFFLRGLWPRKNGIWQGVCILFLVGGMTMGLVYCGNLGIPLLLACGVALDKGREIRVLKPVVCKKRQMFYKEFM